MKYFSLLLLGLTVSVALKSQTQTESRYNSGNLFPASPIIPAGNLIGERQGNPGRHIGRIVQIIL